MKKLSLASFALLTIAFITAQSFYYNSRPKQKIRYAPPFKSFPRYAAMCSTPLILDSAADIPALKGWGNFKWKIASASDSAQYYFNQGISFYYAFHSIEAIASFTKATRLDPRSAMAWYGKALAMGPTINYSNGYVPPKGALQAALKSKELSANCSALEKDLINAIQHRYSADTTADVKQLRTNYANAMEKVYTRHKTNADAITLYADALLLLHPWDLYDQDYKPKEWTPRIQSLLESAIKISPEHPGANHYYIHCVEASSHPQLALRSAYLLDTLMPKASHMTHMPSHIYIRTGDYQRGITVNDLAVEGYNQYLKSYAAVANDAGLYKLHNVQMKGSCAEMAGSYKTAMDVSSDLRKQTADEGYLSLKGGFGNYIQRIYAAPALTRLRFGKWDDILAMQQPDSLVYASALLHFARGVAYSRKHQVKPAKDELKIFREKMEDKSLKEVMDNTSTAYEVCKVAEMILSGVIAEEQKDYKTAVIALQKAVTAEEHLLYSEPRDWPIPARQYLGEVLIKAGEQGKALAVFNKDLEINPNNGWSLTGLKIAYQKLGNDQALKQVNLRLKSAWKIKDTAINNPVF
jgi:tetratricopeptide (TPR) repeat protein